MSRHIVILGGGVIGLCCAYFLAQSDYRVTVLDRGAPADENCSFGNAGLVVPSHIVPLAAPGMMMMGLKWMRDPESPFYVKPRLAPDLLLWGWHFYRAGTAAHVERSAPLLRDLNMASRAAYEELNADLSGFDFEQRGLMMLFKTAQAMDEEAHVVAHARRLGMNAELLDAAAATAREPGLNMDIIGAAYYPDDCHMSPGKLMVALQHRLEEQGAELCWNTSVEGWKMEGRRVRAARVATHDGAGEIEADEWVLCGGSWSPGLVRGLGLRLPLQAGKGYSVTLPHPAHRPSLPAILSEARVAVTPMGTSLRFAGTMEIAGLDTSVNPSRVRGILKAIPAYYPDFTADDFAGVQAWAGLRPCSPDGLPYVGRTARWDNLCIATGHAMMGLSLAPITGKLIAQTVAGHEPQLSLELLNPDRYG